MILYDTIMMDTCHYTFVKTHRICHKEGLNCGLKLIIKYQYWLINYCYNCNKCITLMQDVNN